MAVSIWGRLCVLALFSASALTNFPALPAQTVQAPLSEEKVTSREAREAKPVQKTPVTALWHDPGAISSLNLEFGSGGRERAPRAGAVYTFEKEDRGGTSPKFYVTDQDGVEWLVKVGDEARGETAATRLVWAMGYYTDDDYFVPRLHVQGMKKLHRKSKSVRKDGTVLNARLKRSEKDRKKLANWAWADNPFLGTRELNGLRVMMALINNWDLKTVNNKVYGRREDIEKKEKTQAEEDNQAKGGGHEAMDDDLRYVVSDLGASFGRTGGFSSRSKGKIKGYEKDAFILKIDKETVDFVMRTKPSGVLHRLKPRYYSERVAMAETVDDVPLPDAKWIGQQLSELTPDQIRIAFTSSGFSDAEADAYLHVLQKRIAQLRTL